MRSVGLWVRVLGILLVLTGTSPVGADFGPLSPPALPPSHALVDFPLAGQWWNLSCEYAAASAATKYFNNQISQETFATKIGFDANPNKGFRGNLSGPWGGTWDYGVYPLPILSVLMQQGFPHSYTFRGDANLLRDAISNNRPVVVWINGTYGKAPRYSDESEGETFILVPYEHAVTVYGYNETSVSIMDPAYPAYYDVSWDVFMNAWLQLDGMALVVSV